MAVIGGGPAGLMAAEVLASAGGLQVHLFDAMPSVGRKFLLAGKGGLNLTHGEAIERFIARYADRHDVIGPMLQRFGPSALRDWAHGLGIDTFVGSSGRVFPSDLKAAPLLRAWLQRLRHAGVKLHMRHRWTGWSAASDEMTFDAPGCSVSWRADATVLALGGASWSRLGSDGRWVPWLRSCGVDVAPLRPSNCGFDVARPAASSTDRWEPGWTLHFSSRHAGAPLKNVAIAVPASDGPRFLQAGEFVITQQGVEGSLIYAASAPLRDAIEKDGSAVMQIDLLPARSAAHVAAEVARPRGSRSLSTHLKSRLGLDGVKAALLHELLPREAVQDPVRLAAGIKALPLTVSAPRPIDEAISTAGGVRFESLDDGLMLRKLDAVFCAGEMLDWEAPTGGYLISACMASGVVAAEGVLRRLGRVCG